MRSELSKYRAIAQNVQQPAAKIACIYKVMRIFADNGPNSAQRKTSAICAKYLQSCRQPPTQNPLRFIF
ncbi:hypothetical protein C3R74_02070 [Acidithiobacillus ferridurans]|nr:hypothetical protein C3R74_02070 [Acidithiobacillus ferridurans]